MAIQPLISTEFGDTSMVKINNNFSELDIGKASDTAVLHKTGNETKTGTLKVDFVKIGGTPVLNDANTMQVAFSVDGGFTRHMDFIGNGGQNDFIGGTTIGFWNNQPGEANATEKMTIAPNGNVGIGNTNPTEKLDINGNLKVNGRIWSNAWDIHSVVATGDSGSGATLNVLYSKYKVVGKSLTIQIRAILTNKGTCGGTFFISSPIASIENGLLLAGGVYAVATGPNGNKGWVTTNGSAFIFTSSSQNAVLQWSNVAVGDEIHISGAFEIA